MQKARKIGALSLILVTLALFMGVLAYERIHKPDTVRVRLKWLNQAQFAGFYVAKEKGFYSRQNLNVHLEPGGLDFPAIQLVGSGTDDFGVTGAEEILLARSKGIPVVAIALISQLRRRQGLGITKQREARPAEA